jgi:putative oxidoreductase
LKAGAAGERKAIMHIVFTLGRFLLVLIFILSGAMKLLDISGTAATIAPVVVVPEALADYVRQIEGVTGMKVAQLLAILTGAVELVGGLLIAFNIATRPFAALLAIFTVVATFYFHDFWNMTGAARDANTIHVLKNLAIIGGLLILFVLGSWRPTRPTHV